jgi:hypothetical protein
LKTVLLAWQGDESARVRQALAEPSSVPAGQFVPEVVSLSRRRAIVACAHAAGSAAAVPIAKARSWKLAKATLTCAVALAATLVAPPGLSATSPEEPTEEYTQAGKRYRTGYVRWRERLQRRDLYVGRNLLAGVHAAAGSTRPPTEEELRSSTRRMQQRWGRWLRTTADGRSFAFRRRVRRVVPGWGKATLRSIAACESHSNPRAIGGGGTHRGLYQFSLSTWRVVGGDGDPAAASRWEQTWRAWLLLSRHGSGHWPVCG